MEHTICSLLGRRCSLRNRFENCVAFVILTAKTRFYQDFLLNISSKTLYGLHWNLVHSFFLRPRCSPRKGFKNAVVFVILTPVLKYGFLKLYNGNTKTSQQIQMKLGT